MPPKQLTGPLKNFKYHDGILLGQTEDVDGVPVVGDGKPFYYQPMASGTSLMIARDWAYPRNSKEATGLRGGSRRDSSTQATPQPEVEGEQTGTSSEGVQTSTNPGETTASTQTNPVGQTPSGQIQATRSSSIQTIPAPQTQGGKTRAAPLSSAQTNPAAQLLSSQTGAGSSSANGSSAYEASSLVYQSLPVGFYIDAEAYRRLPRVPQLSRPGRRDKPWGRKCFGTASNGTTAAGGASKPTGSTGTAKVTKKPAGAGKKNTKPAGGGAKTTNKPVGRQTRATTRKGAGK